MTWCFKICSILRRFFKIHMSLFQRNLSDVFVGHRIRRFFLHWACYPLVNQHSNGTSPFSIGNTSSKGPFSMSILVYRRVLGLFVWKRNRKHQVFQKYEAEVWTNRPTSQGVLFPPPLQQWRSRRIIDKTGSILLGPRKSKYQTLPLGSRESFIWIIPKTILCLVLDFQGGDMLRTRKIKHWH